jgi:hypothetical protein
MRDVIAGLLPQIAKSLGRDFEEPATWFRGARGNKRLAAIATVAAVILAARGAGRVFAACGTLVSGISTLTWSASSVRGASMWGASMWGGRAFSLAVFPTVAATTAAFARVFVEAWVAGWSLRGSAVGRAGRALVLLRMARRRRARVRMTRGLFGATLIGAVFTCARGACIGRRWIAAPLRDCLLPGRRRSRTRSIHARVSGGWRTGIGSRRTGRGRCGPWLGGR